MAQVSGDGKGWHPDSPMPLEPWLYRLTTLAVEPAAGPTHAHCRAEYDCRKARGQRLASGGLI
ncbi:MAG: hypothetical protein COS34_02310 [Lysobacterales bacterium CG02_land_8_20_14_3_00_62_12]|nr:MAG: hypothetical protein COS34_02310 [Xanthomonadales bacterium CG02_land_8_20_14_3_00_62_12]